ncbi:uncharacterized protein LOC111716912 [Eurytemora carolleeae]|uniref:uncharacterized protein LOC111716912 n=1 Tax=Eurytemora carolleeae TaxID=1294199 RepID=UPI000C770D07|nr:uncharacterized protein LOC111716912 [Eurytemora carolleeae]|eukprot:XP_023348188.1 uncharacterized protein LOC111716912 [Eurytemora affinis]
MASNGYDANSGAKISFLDSLGPVHPGGIKNLTKLQKLVRLCQYGVIGSLEHFFTWYGEKVACNPRTAIAACILATFLGGLGLIRFYEEGDAASLVIPRNSKFRNDIDWLDNNFPQEIRVHRIIYEADNVLTPTVIKAIYKQRKDLEKLTMQDKTFKDMCIKVPILKFPENLQLTDPTVTNIPNKEDEDWGFDDEFEKDGLPTISPNVSLGGLLNYFIPNKDLDLDMLQRYSNDFYPVPYCAVAQSTELACYEENIVELWGDSGSYNQESDALIESLTEEDILRTINTNNISNIFLKEKNFKEMLGGIKYNHNGEIIGAGAVLIKFYTSVNVSAVKLFGTASRGEKIDTVSYSFEGEMIKLLTNKTEFPAEMVSYVSVQRQFFESFVGQTFKDSDKLGMGYALVFIYVNFMLSKLNCVEQRVWLSCVGILSVAMGMILAYGVCSAFGWFYSAAHTVIPFLLLGIGIDNIFVITQAYDTLESSGVPLSLGKRFGKTMGHAGVAVSVTTFTDVFAFLVGSNTVLPGLESFCIYAAVSILAIYLMQVTHFLAWMSLGQFKLSFKFFCFLF